MNKEDPTRLKRVKRLQIREISGVERGGAPGAEIKIMRTESSLWDRFVEKMGFKRMVDPNVSPMTTQEILEADAQKAAMYRLENAFHESVYKILEYSKGTEKVALLKKSVAEFAEATEGMTEMQRSAHEIGALLNQIETPDMLPDTVVEHIKRAIKPQTQTENEAVEMSDIEDILKGLTSEQVEAFKRHFAPEVVPVVETVQRNDDGLAKLASMVETLAQKVDALSNSKESDELVAVARAYNGVGKTHDEILVLLRGAKQGGSAVYSAVLASLDIAQKNADVAERLGFYAETGASGAAFTANPDSANAKVERQAQKLVDEGKFDSVTMARASIFAKNPNVRKAVDTEQRAQAAKYI